MSECLDVALLPPQARGLDLGCAVGRSTFELARHCASVVGIDYSERFIAAAQELQRGRRLPYQRVDEGARSTALEAVAPPDVPRERVAFEQGDAMHLRSDLGAFDVVLMANLIDRLRKPALLLERLPGLVRPGGQLIITSPYTWLPEFTPVENWLGGTDRQSTVEGLRATLEPAFTLAGQREMPFLIREHVRKYQWSVAHATLWRRSVS